MKKVLFTLVAAIFVSMVFTSCSKCQRCTKSDGSEVRICEKDYNSNTAYGLAIDFQESQGYNCN